MSIADLTSLHLFDPGPSPNLICLQLLHLEIGNERSLPHGIVVKIQ